ncbi:MAG TPA: RnfABCDGE type electron transport complex subunit G [Coriobacteriia bacterium]|nr:RnfABCDGE type electron transport complex subunit G [Coriobacteriia bacterium]
MPRRAPSTPLNMVATVLVTCVVAATSLAFTYEVTRDRIVQQELEAERAALEAVVPDAESFQDVSDMVAEAEVDTEDVPVESAHRALDADGATAGWAVRVAPRGYAGPVAMVVGLDRDGTVLGVSIVRMRETPGLGTKIAEQWFIEQFVGWESMDLDAWRDEFDAIAGATKSSVAVREGVSAACAVYLEALMDSGEGGGGS